MLTLQHTLVELLSVDGDMDLFKKEIPYVLIPDAIRFYSKTRQPSHFEINPANGQISCMMFPLDIKALTEKNISNYIVMAEDIASCAVGEETIIEKFEATNKHLPKNYYNGVKKHLIQDHEFDDYLRNIVDFSKKHEGRFFYEGYELNAKDARDLFTGIEMQGFVLMAKEVYERYGITINQEWFDENVKPILYNYYPEDMAANTYKYMAIDKELDKKLTNHIYHLGITHVDNEPYISMYQNAVTKCQEVNRVEEEREV